METIEIDGYPYMYEKTGAGAPVWVFLHGFLGSHADFSEIAPQGTIIRLDLLGFGSDKPTVDPAMRFDSSQQVAELQRVLRQLTNEPIRLVGYSMGARLALAYALTYPENLEMLVLESGTPGLAEATARTDRQKVDQQKAEHVGEVGMERFIDEWEQMPLFKSQEHVSQAQQTFMHQQRVQQNVENVQASLNYFGTGQMPNFWPDLADIQLPTILINGATDQKFLGISDQMETRLTNGRRFVISDAGHNVHFEAPQAFEALLNQL